MARPAVLLLSFLLIATVFVFALAEPDCVYTFLIKTGTRNGAGTDSVIGVIISDKSGQRIEIKNLERWGGVMGPGHDYYESGNLNILSGKERCLTSPVCFLTLTSDGSGDNPGWYVNYVEVTTTKAGESKHEHFNMEQWLAIDESPYELSTERNNCPEG